MRRSGVWQRLAGRRGAAVAGLVLGLLAITQSASGAPPLVPIAPPTGPVASGPGEQFHSFTDNGALIYTKGTVLKAKTSVLLPLTLGHAYTNFIVTQPDPVSHIKITADLYVVSPTNVAQRYGYLPPARVTVLAFGAIPVTATVQLVQPLLKTGYLDPIHAKQDFVNTGNTEAVTNVTGNLEVHLSDVTVDQVPLDVGPNCATAAPAVLRLLGHAPDYASPVTGGPLSGTIDIGAFAHCGATEDLDPLITAMISGKGNPVKANQGKLGLWVYPQSCPLVTDPNNEADTGCGVPIPPK